MAIYKHTYSPYTGPLMPRWPRFFILTRYSYARILQSTAQLVNDSFGTAVKARWNAFK